MKRSKQDGLRQAFLHSVESTFCDVGRINCVLYSFAAKYRGLVIVSFNQLDITIHNLLMICYR